jgi:hypothetical protein
VREKLRAISARKLLLLLDCCYATGVWSPREPAQKNEPWQKKSSVDDRVIASLGEGKGRVVLSSSRRDQTSFVGRPYSVFTTALVEALCGDGAAERDGFVRVADLIGHVGRRVRELTQNYRHVQEPTADFRETDNFNVAYYGAGEVTTKGPPEWMQPVEPLPELLQYPPGPRVPFLWLHPAVIGLYANQYPSSTEAQTILGGAARRLREADPEATYPKPRNLNTPEYVGAEPYWTKTFEEASKHGPRMVAALLLELDESRLVGEVKTQRARLLANMRDPDLMERENR